MLKIKIIEESDARKCKVRRMDETAMIMSGGGNQDHTRRKVGGPNRQKRVKRDGQPAR